MLLAIRIAVQALPGLDIEFLQQLRARYPHIKYFAAGKRSLAKRGLN
jgi:hypothetical protein